MDPRFQKVDELFSSFDKTTSPGCSLAIIQDGEILYTRGYGMANLEHSIPNQPWTRFYLASMSKQFTAFCIALLEEEGKLDLDDDIRKWLPEIPQYQWPITVQHLVHHTSGLRDYLGLNFMAGHPMDDLITEPETLELLSRQKELNFNPGDEYLYSNTGYILMSMIIARASGKSFRQYADEMIFQPLGMKHTHVHDNHLEMVPQRATGYAPAAQGYQISVPNFDMVGDGGIYSCVLDLYKWDQNFYHNRLGKGRSDLIERVLSTRKLNDGSDNNYAFGLMVEQFQGLREVNHGGAYGGYRTEMIRFPEQNFSVIVLGNHAGFRSGDLAHQVADLFLADQYTKDVPAASPAPASGEYEPDLQAYSGLYYADKTGISLKIKVEEGRLAAQVSDEFTAPLKPAGPHAFEADGGPLPMRLIFQNDDLDVAFGVGKPMHFKRLTVQALDDVLLEQLCGVFTSEELDARCRIEMKDGNLVYKIGSLTETLRPVNEGMYLLSSGALYTDGITNSPATGFTLQAGRVRNIRFSRSI